MITFIKYNSKCKVRNQRKSKRCCRKSNNTNWRSPKCAANNKNWVRTSHSSKRPSSAVRQPKSALKMKAKSAKRLRNWKRKSKMRIRFWETAAANCALSNERRRASALRIWNFWRTLWDKRKRSSNDSKRKWKHCRHRSGRRRSRLPNRAKQKTMGVFRDWWKKSVAADRSFLTWSNANRNSLKVCGRRRRNWERRNKSISQSAQREVRTQWLSNSSKRKCDAKKSRVRLRQRNSPKRRTVRLQWEKLWRVIPTSKEWKCQRREWRFCNRRRKSQRQRCGMHTGSMKRKSMSWPRSSPFCTERTATCWLVWQRSSNSVKPSRAVSRISVGLCRWCLFGRPENSLLSNDFFVFTFLFLTFCFFFQQSYLN